MSDVTQEPDVQAGKLRGTPARDWIIRFAFGAAVSALAGVITKLCGPTVGGLFLSFPAILLASLTRRRARTGPGRTPAAPPWGRSA